MERIPEIDGLRALAALSVFVRHAFGFRGIVRFASAGWVGVDLFFVISGYLITTILLEMREAPAYFKTFYMRRTLRIFPPYYAFFIVCFTCAAVTRSYHFSLGLWLAYAFYGTSLLAESFWYPKAVSRLPGPVRAMDVTWSLSIEELFYLLWAPAVRFLKREHLGVLVTIMILSAPLVRWWVHTPGSLAEYYFFPARMDTLAFGALLALRRNRRAGNFLVPAWFVVLGLVASASMLFLIDNPQYNLFFAVAGYSVIAITMTLLLDFVLDHKAHDNLLCRLLRSRPLLWLGTISYAFYLLHLFVILSFRNLFADLWASHWVLNRLLQLTCSLGVTLLIAGLSWKYFESPILRLKSRFQIPNSMSSGVYPSPASDQLPDAAVSESN